MDRVGERVRVSCNQFEEGGLCLKKGTPIMEMEEEVEKEEEEEEIVITLQDIAEVAMTEEAGNKQADGCQREEDDNQLDSDLSKVKFSFSKMSIIQR